MSSRGRKFAVRLLCAAMAMGLSAGAQAQASASKYTTGYRYDAAMRLVGTINASANVNGVAAPFAASRITYNSVGLVQSKDVGSLATWKGSDVLPSAWGGDFTVFFTESFTYDNLGRVLTKRTTSGGTTYTLTQYEYDSEGLVKCSAQRMNPAVYGSLPASACTLGTEGTQGPDRITFTTYDSGARPLEVTKAYGTSLAYRYAKYTYNANGSMESLTDANGNYSFNTYDDFNRQQRAYFPSKTTAGSYNTADFEEYTYYVNDARKTLRKRDTNLITYHYDALSRLVDEIYPAGTVQNVYYDYDLRNLQTYARYGSDTGPGLTQAYDGFGRLQNASTNQSGSVRALSYLYDLEGNRTRVTHPDGAYFVYGYDGLNRLSTIHENGVTLIDTEIYDAAGRRQSRQRGAGVSQTGYSYDAISRLQTLTQDLAGSSYDETRTFGYNPANQITSRNLSSAAYSYNQAPNTTTNYTVNGLNQYASLTAGASVTPTYDANGNMTYDGNATYGYDVLNRMISATGGRVANLSYDPRGRLFQTSGGQSGTTQYLYDGSALVGEYNSAGTLLRRYVHGQGVDDPVVWYEGSAVGSGNRRYLHADHQGSIVAATDANGNAVNAPNAYDAYGVPASTNTGRFQYTGQIMLPDLGLYHYKARAYNAQIGRFMQTDPIGYKDDVDLYTYVENDPLNKHDPDGRRVVILGSEVFVAKVYAAFAKIAEGPAGRALLQAAQSEKTPLIAISESKNNNVAVYDNTADKAPTGASIGWNPNKTEGGMDISGSKERPAFVGLAHDLGHGVAAGQGRQPLPKNDPKEKTPGSTPPSEKPAVDAENAVRREHSIPLRDGYYDKHGH